MVDWRKRLDDTVLHGNLLCGVCAIPCSCLKITNTSVAAPNLAIVRALNATECCSACAKYPRCVVAVYHYDNTYCELKNVTTPTFATPNADMVYP